MRKDRAERIEYIFQQIEDMGLDTYVRSRVLSEPIPQRLANRLSREIFSQQGIDRLTNRERQVLTLLLAGMKKPAIARALNVREDTVKRHVQMIYLKLEVSSLPEALYQSARQGWLVNL